MNRLLLLSRGEFEAFYNHAEQEKQALRAEFLKLSSMVYFLFFVFYFLFSILYIYFLMHM